MDHKSDLPGSADFDRLESQLFERISVRYRRQVMRHRLVAVAAVLVVAGAGVAAGTVANPTLQTRVAYCYGGDSTSSRVSELELPNNKEFATKPGAKATSAQVANAVALCGSIWRQGVFSGSSPSAPHQVPQLQACLRDDLVVSIFRKTDAGESADSFCNNLGLSAP
jgi:hypothetical protein